MDERQQVVGNLAESGHNLLITGLPGTGKSYVISLIVDRLQMNDKSVAITASTGKAASVLREKIQRPVFTIHRFVGIMDGRFSDLEILDLLMHSGEFEKQKSNIMHTDVLIIDEISMISTKTFNQIEYIFRNIRNKTKVFGCVQVIIAGDFFQLPPVPNHEYGDDGSLIIVSSLMKFFHHVNITEIHRQDESDFITAIHEMSRGEISTPSEQLLSRLQRTLPPGEDPVKLFARNLDVDIWNAKCLLEMEEKFWQERYDYIQEVKELNRERERQMKLIDEEQRTDEEREWKGVDGRDQHRHEAIKGKTEDEEQKRDEKRKRKRVDETEQTRDEKRNRVDEMEQTRDEKRKRVDEMEQTRDEKRKRVDEMEQTRDEKRKKNTVEEREQMRKGRG